MRNAEAPWDLFDPVSTWARNYDWVRNDDAEIIGRLVQFVVALPANCRAVDIGPGSNLYPAFALSATARQLVLLEHGRRNAEWLRDLAATESLPETWRGFAELVCAGLGGTPEEVWSAFRAIVEVRPGNLFDVAKASFDVATMFFVAESMTDDPDEFVEACESFVGVLTPGGSCFAAFVEGSLGYDADGIGFPAVNITAADLHAAFSPLLETYEVHRISSGDAPPGADYTGVLVVHGVRHR